MLIDIYVDHHYNPQVVAGELKACEDLVDPDVYFSARIIRGTINGHKLGQLRRHAGVASATKSDGHKIRGGSAPVLEPASLGLGLCDPAVIFTPEQRAAQARGLEEIARRRRQPPPNDVFV